MTIPAADYDDKDEREDNAASFDCDCCPYGKHGEDYSTPGCSDCAMGKYNARTECTIDPASSCSTGDGGCMFCSQCPANTIQPSYGSSSCTACAEHEWSPAGSGWEQCPYCDAGEERPSDLLSCRSCNAGYASVSGSACVECAAGKYSGNKAGTCSNCLAGTYSAADGSTSCANCAAGTGNTDLATSLSTCGACAAGKYSEAGDACADCANGEYAISGSSSCTICGGDNRASTIARSTCNDCYSGTAEVYKISIHIEILTDADAQSIARSLGCEHCRRGFAFDEAGHNANGNRVGYCKRCNRDLGTYSDATSARGVACSFCSPGHEPTFESWDSVLETNQRRDRYRIYDKNYDYRRRKNPLESVSPDFEDGSNMDVATGCMACSSGKFTHSTPSDATLTHNSFVRKDTDVDEPEGDAFREKDGLCWSAVDFFKFIITQLSLDFLDRSSGWCGGSICPDLPEIPLLISKTNGFLKDLDDNDQLDSEIQKQAFIEFSFPFYRKSAGVDDAQTFFDFHSWWDASSGMTGVLRSCAWHVTGTTEPTIELFQGGQWAPRYEQHAPVDEGTDMTPEEMSTSFYIEFDSKCKECPAHTTRKWTFIDIRIAPTSTCEDCPGNLRRELGEDQCECPGSLVRGKDCIRDHLIMMGQTWEEDDFFETCFEIDEIPTCKAGYHHVSVVDVDVCRDTVKNLMYVCKKCEDGEAVGYQIQTSVIESKTEDRIYNEDSFTYDFRTCSRCPLGQFVLMASESLASYPEAACFQCPPGFYDPPKEHGNGKLLPADWTIDVSTSPPSLKLSGSPKTVSDILRTSAYTYLCGSCQPGTFFPLDYAWTTDFTWNTAAGSITIDTGAYNEYDRTGDTSSESPEIYGKCSVGSQPRCPCMVCPMNSYTSDVFFGNGCYEEDAFECLRKWHTDYGIDVMPCLTCATNSYKDVASVFTFESDSPNNNYIDDMEALGETDKVQRYRNQGLAYMQRNMIQMTVQASMCEQLEPENGQTIAYALDITDKIACASTSSDWYSYGTTNAGFVEKYGECIDEDTRRLALKTPKFTFIRCGHTNSVPDGNGPDSVIDKTATPQLNDDGICQECAGVHSVISSEDAQICNQCLCPDPDESNVCKYKNDEGICAPIQAGYYRDGDSVTPCPEGQYSEPGHYWAGESSDQTKCRECHPGFYQNEMGKATCKNCNAFFREPGACSAGTECNSFLFYQSGSGKTMCDKCEPRSNGDYKMQACATNSDLTGDCSTGDIAVPDNQLNPQATCFYCREDEEFDPSRDSPCGSCPGNQISVNNACVDCAPGKFKIGENKCQSCQGCPVGYYMKDMSVEGIEPDCRDITQCTKCPTEQCNADEVLVGCFNVPGKFDESGTCVPRELTQPTAVCPRLESLIHQDAADIGVQSDDSKLSTFKSNFGLSGFTFEELFTKDPANVDFQCRRTCDGTSPFTYRSATQATEDGGETEVFNVEYGISDGGQCQGPFACNVMACTMLSGEDAFEASFRVPQACPVEDPVYDPDNNNPSEYSEAMQQSCATCDVCGTGEYSGTLDWGRGCAKECTRLICADYEIFDWTRDKQPLGDACTSCEFLEDERLCTRADQEKIGFDVRNVSGLIPVIHFADCVPKDGGVRLRQLESETRKSYPSYGNCLECDRDDPDLDVDGCGLREYFAGCSMSFLRLFRGEVVPRCKKCIGLEGAELRTQTIQGIRTDSLHLQCQIGLCNLGFSGIDDVGRVCFEMCEPVVCPDAYFAIPCALPHRARCFKRTHLHEDDRFLVGETPAHLNLLEKHYSSPPQLYARFENLLLDSAVSDEQCVWNAQIRDNYMNPGGISTNFFDRDCREWSVDQAGIEYPLLPLQNSVLVDGDTSGWRRFFTNTQAWAVAERTTGIGTTALKLDLRVKKNVSLALRVPKDDIENWSAFDSVQHFVMSLWVRATSPGVFIDIDKAPEFSDIFRIVGTPSEPSSNDESSSEKSCVVSADKIHYTSRKCNFQFSYSVTGQETGSYTFVGIAFDTYTQFESLRTITDRNEVRRTLPQFSSLRVRYKAVDTLRLNIEMTKVLPVISLQPSPDESCFVYLSSETAIYCVGDVTTRVFPQVRPDEITILRFFAPFKIEGDTNIYSFIVRADTGGKQRHLVYNHNTDTESNDFTLSFRIHALCQSQTSGNNRALLAVAETNNVFMLVMFKFYNTLKPEVWVLDRDIKIAEEAHHDVHWILASNANGVVFVVPTTDNTLQIWRWSPGFSDGSEGFLNRIVTRLSVTKHAISAESTLETKFTTPPRVFFESTDLLFSLNDVQYLFDADDVLSLMPYDPRFTGKLYAVFFESIVSITKFKKQSSETIHHQCHPGYQLEVETKYNFGFEIKSPSSSHCAQLCFEGRETGEFGCVAYQQIGSSTCKIFDSETAAGESGVCKSDDKTRSVINTILSPDPKKSIDVLGQNEFVNLYMNLQAPFVKITTAKTDEITYVGSGYVKVDDVNDEHISIIGSDFGESSRTTYTAADDAIHHLATSNWYQPQWVPAKTVLQMPTLLGSQSSQITYESDENFFLLILRMDCSIGLTLKINGGSGASEVSPVCNGDEGVRITTLVISQNRFINGKPQRSRVDYGEKNQNVYFTCSSVQITLQSGTEIMASKSLQTIYETQDALNLDARELLELYGDAMKRNIDTEWHVFSYNIAGTYLDMHEAITFNFEKETEDHTYVYVDDITVVPRLSHTSQYSVPIKCPEGSIPEYPLDPLSECIKSPAGTFSRANVLYSEPCPQGTFSTQSGQSQCTECPAGKYLGVTGSSADDCQDCPSGKFSTVVGATGCSGCGVGQIYSDTDTQCIVCTAGKFSGVHDTECSDCMPGFWSDEGVGSCIPCEIGTYSTEAAANSIETCIDCPPGTYGSTEGAVECVDAPKNTFQMKRRAVLADCLACSVPNAPATSTPGTSNVSQCVCGLGSYGTAGDCRPCPLHATSNDNAGTINDCFCNAGFRQSPTRSAWTCVQCGEGSFSPANASRCSQCTAGKYSDVPGASECKFCPGGKSSVPGMAHCVTSLCSECPVGTYQPVIGATNESACLACEAGKFSYGLAGSCSVCRHENCSHHEAFRPEVQEVQEEEEEETEEAYEPAPSARRLLQAAAEPYPATTRKLIVIVTLPTTADYVELGLDPEMIGGSDSPSVSPLQGSNAENWERLHVRVLLGTHGQPIFNGCRYRVHVGRIDEQNQLFIEGRHAELGCSVEIVDHFSDCYLEIPTAMANTANEVVVWAVTTSDTQQCEWPERFEVTLHPHASVYQCPHEEFWSESLGKCVSCELEITQGLGLDASCTLGKYIKGCDVLAGSSPQCEDCPLPEGGWDAAIYTWVSGAVCAYECAEGYWRSGTECLACSNVLSCSDNTDFAPGYQVQACTDVQDETCVPCERPQNGVYSEFEEFVYHAEECKTDCIQGEYYRAESTQPCLPCQTLTQLRNRLDATRLSNTFYRFVACTPGADSYYAECDTSVANGLFVGDSIDFGLPCQISCDVGYFDDQYACTACPPTDASFAYTDGKCTRQCNTDAGYYENDAGVCVDCNVECEIGQYKRVSSSPTCECTDCARSTTGPHWQFVSPGNLIDNAYSCTEECSVGHFADFDVCKPHSTPTCASNQFLVNGTSSLDATCFQCQNCNERRKLADCTATADTQCENCDPAEPPVGARYTLSDCSPLCLDGFVQRRSAEPAFVCDACVGFQCAPGSYTPSDRQNCTHCEACSSAPRHATFYGSSCQWACPFGWVRQQTADDDRCAPQVTDAQQNYEGFQDMRRSGGYGCPPLSCPYGMIPVPQLRACSQCRPCNETAVDTPDPTDHNATWLWRVGLDCQFECKRGWFRLRQGTVVRCVDEATYEQQLSQFTTTVSADTTWTSPGWNGERRTSTKDDSTQFSLMLVLVFVFASTLLSVTLLCT